ncbi:MAG TPA: hypothetical protein PKD85_05750 [Saprospiraceae bacterium]|nr:hypothetical protein [Saprospiraceae bacterium]
MNNTFIRNLLRGLGLILFQVAVLARLDLSIGDFTFIHIIIYPFFVLLLPINTPKVGVLILAFATGIFVDFFYNSPGVHAASMLVTAYLRPLVLRILVPNEGYSTKFSPTLIQMGFNWFISYTSISLFIFCFSYFSFDAFSFVYFFGIFMNAVFTIIPSIFVFIIIHYLFRSKI